METDEDEFLECVTVPFKQALDLIKRGAIKDSKTIVGILSCAISRKLY
jgi:hypothetical protein